MHPQADNYNNIDRFNWMIYSKGIINLKHHSLEKNSKSLFSFLQGNRTIKPELLV